MKGLAEAVATVAAESEMVEHHHDKVHSLGILMDACWVTIVYRGQQIAYPVTILNKGEVPTVRHAISALWARVGIIRKYAHLDHYARFRNTKPEDVAQEHALWTQIAEQTATIFGKSFGMDRELPGQRYEETKP